MLQKTKTRTATLLFLICWLCFFLPGCRENNQEIETKAKIIKTELPPKYKMLCSNGKYLPTMPGGTRLYKEYPYTPFDNYQDAIDKAWDQYNFSSPPPDTVIWNDCEMQGKK